jgi:hypothetical protein
MNVIAPARLSARQEEEVRNLWRDCFGFSAMTVNGRDLSFPTTIEGYDDLTGNESGVSQAQLDEFIDDLRYGHRCRVCAGVEDVMEMGRCVSCEQALEGQ